MAIARRLALGRIVSLTGPPLPPARPAWRSPERPLALALGGMAVAGAGRGLGDVAGTTLLQAWADDEVRSRVFAAQDGAAHLAFTLAALSGGLLVEAVSTRGAFAAAAGCAFGAVAVAARVRETVPGERRSSRRDE